MPTFDLLLLLAWVLASLLARGLGFRALSRVVASGAKPHRAPPTNSTTTLARSVHGAPPRFADAMDSLCRAADAGGARVLIGCSRPDDPALAEVALVRTRHPRVVLDVRVGMEAKGVNPKIRTLVQTVRDDRAEVLVLSDADVRVPSDYVSRTREPFDDPLVGLATSPYRSVRHLSFASRVDAAMTNLHFLPATCLAVELEGLHFGLGATVAVRRSALERAGGLESLLEEPADDYFIARNVEQAGFRLAWVPMLVDHLLEDEGCVRITRRHVRWSGTVRSNRPGGYLGMVFTHGILGVVALAILSPPWGAAALLLHWGLSAVFIAPARRALELTSADFLLLPCFDLCAALVWISGLFAGAGVPGAHRARARGSAC